MKKFWLPTLTIITILCTLIFVNVISKAAVAPNHDQTDPVQISNLSSQRLAPKNSSEPTQSKFKIPDHDNERKFKITFDKSSKNKTK